MAAAPAAGTAAAGLAQAPGERPAELALVEGRAPLAAAIPAEAAPPAGGISGSFMAAVLPLGARQPGAATGSQTPAGLQPSSGPDQPARAVEQSWPSAAVPSAAAAAGPAAQEPSHQPPLAAGGHPQQAAAGEEREEGEVEEMPLEKLLMAELTLNAGSPPEAGAGGPIQPAQQPQRPPADERLQQLRALPPVQGSPALRALLRRCAQLQ